VLCFFVKIIELHLLVSISNLFKFCTAYCPDFCFCTHSVVWL